MTKYKYVTTRIINLLRTLQSPSESIFGTIKSTFQKHKIQVKTTQLAVIRFRAISVAAFCLCRVYDFSKILYLRPCFFKMRSLVSLTRTLPVCGLCHRFYVRKFKFCHVRVRGQTVLVHLPLSVWRLQNRFPGVSDTVASDCTIKRYFQQNGGLLMKKLLKNRFLSLVQNHFWSFLALLIKRRSLSPFEMTRLYQNHSKSKQISSYVGYNCLVYPSYNQGDYR